MIPFGSWPQRRPYGFFWRLPAKRDRTDYSRHFMTPFGSWPQRRPYGFFWRLPEDEQDIVGFDLNKKCVFLKRVNSPRIEIIDGRF